MTDLISRLLDLAVEIQQIPAPTFQEAARAEFVRTRFTKEGLADVEMDSLGNVYARLRGSGSGKALVVSAHLDTVFPASVDLQLQREPEPRAGTGTTARIQAPGIGDNSLGVAALFGLVWALRERSQALPGDLWLAANVCEEGLGDLRGMKSVVSRFGAAPPRAGTGTTPPRAGTGTTPLAYVVLEGVGLGHIYHRGLGVRRYRISVHTSGGHSWIDYGQPSAIHELATFSAHLAALELPRTPRTTLNIGIISGGSSINTIAAEAMLELDLRSEEVGTLDALSGQVEQMVQAARKPGVEVVSEIIGERPSGGIPEEHPLVRLAQDCLREVGIEPHLSTGSTDANLPLSLGLPAVTICLTTGGRAHSAQEFINIPPLEKGLEQLIRLVSRAFFLP